MYTVLFTIQCDDGRRFEPGPSNLAGATESEARAWLANGWLAGPSLDEAAPEPPAPEALALTHYEGAGDPPPGTWEHYWHAQAAQAAPAEASPRKRRKSEE